MDAMTRLQQAGWRMDTAIRFYHKTERAVLFLHESRGRWFLLRGSEMPRALAPTLADAVDAVLEPVFLVEAVR